MESPPAGSGRFDLDAMLAFHRPSLLRFVEREARGLLARESAEDLVQGIHLRALKAASGYQHSDERGFLSWIATLARRHIADRHEHWAALRRAAPGAIHISQTWSSSSGGVVPVAPSVGPATRAVRAEDIERAISALDHLEPRDRELIEGLVNDVPLELLAKNLGLNYEAAKKARQRAVERLRQAIGE